MTSDFPLVLSRSARLVMVFCNRIFLRQNLPQLGAEHLHVARLAESLENSTANSEPNLSAYWWTEPFEKLTT